MTKASKRRVVSLKTQLKKLESALTVRHEDFLTILDKSLDALFIVDKLKKVCYANDAALQLCKKSRSALLNKTLPFSVDLLAVEKLSRVNTELVLQHADDMTSVLDISIVSATWHETPGYLVSIQDVTAKKKTEAFLDYMTAQEAITDLPHRLAFERHMASAMHDAEEYDSHMAVLLLDIDDFKLVNDTFGRDIGDAVLEAVLARLKCSIRKGDTVEQLGHDQFAIILNNLRKAEYAGVVAQNVLTTLDQPFKIKGEKVYLSASIGIAVYPSSATTAIVLMQYADIAMCSAKHQGKNQYRFYSTMLDSDNERALLIASGLRNAIRNNELFILYQPIVDLKTGHCIGIEALIRWQHPALGLLLPLEFLPVVERLNLMPRLGKWVTRQVFSDFKAFDNETLLFVAINMTANELVEDETVQDIFDAVKEFDVPIEKVIFELTETSVVKNPERLVEKLKRLFDTQINLAIDDYGTGYSSLSYLKHLPVSILKIDKSFVAGIGRDVNSIIILKSSIHLAHELGLKVVAEGVEDKAQLEFLMDAGCDYIQGYYFSRPIPLKEAVKFIKDSHKKNQ